MNCGDCKACCTSSLFIHIKPEENRTLNRIRKEILFEASGLPKGNMLLGYDLNGHCPMFIDNKCSIYEHKPLTCSNYDCRIFTAIGISEEERKTKIIQQSPHWKFSYPAKRDREQHIAVQAAAKFIRERAECFPAGLVPVNTSQLAITAIKVYDVFLKINKEFNKTGRVSSDMETARAIMEANEKFETSRRCEKK